MDEIAEIIPKLKFLGAEVPEHAVVLTTIAIRIKAKDAISPETLPLSKMTIISSVISRNFPKVSKKRGFFRVSKKEGLPRVFKEKSLPGILK